MKEIALTGGHVALVDDEDYDRFAMLKWYAGRSQSGKFYATRRTAAGTFRLSREIVAAPPGFQVDHVNGNTLDNRKTNLRLCSNAQNQQNAKLRSDNGSGFKGVIPSYKRRPWRAGLRVDGKRIHLGYFDTAEAAALAYDAAARQHFGAFARTNFPSPATPEEGT